MSELTKLSPEGYDIANAYLIYGTIDDTADQLDLPRYEVAKILQKPEIRRYLDGVYLDKGYRNRDKLGALVDKIIDQKIADAADSGEYTKKDLLEIMQFAHKMRMDEIKAAKEAPDQSTTVQIANFPGGAAYNDLMGRLLNGK